MLRIEREAKRLKADPLEAHLREVARREGVLLRFLDDDPETVRLVLRHAGAAIAVYERADATDKEANGADR